MNPQSISQNLLALGLDSGLCTLPLCRVHHIAACAALVGPAEEYFLGWLNVAGDYIPVFDLNYVLCERPTPLRFGSRIVVVETSPHAPVPRLGLLAPHVTEVLRHQDAIERGATPLDLDQHLAMLYPFLPSAMPEPA